MKKILTSKWLLVFFFLVQGSIYAQDSKIKIYESTSGNGACVIVFPNSPEPLMVMTGNGECTILKAMAHDDWHEMSGATVVTAGVVDAPAKTQVVAHSVKSPRDAASGQATGKRQHKPYLLSSLTVDGLDGDSDGDGIEIYSFSWGMSNSGGMSSSAAGGKIKTGYDVKTSTKRTADVSSASSTSSCCSNGVCSVTVSVDKKHTKTGHVTLLK